MRVGKVVVSKFMRCSSIKKVRAGTVLVKQGDVSTNLYLIHHGEARLFSQGGGHPDHHHHHHHHQYHEHHHGHEPWTLELLPALYSHDCFGLPLVDPRQLKKVWTELTTTKKRFDHVVSKKHQLQKFSVVASTEMTVLEVRWRDMERLSMAAFVSVWTAFNERYACYFVEGKDFF